MNQPQEKIPFVKDDWDSIAGLQRFSHEAMATTFEVIIQYDDARYARQAADAAFDELDRLEAQLSRFIENSDISRINNLTANQPLRIGLAAFECLQLSNKIYTETNGAFDITVGSLLNCWRDKDGAPRTPSREALDLARQLTGTDLIKLDEAEYTVELLKSPVHIDLGGMGKGYAVDRMAEMLREWSIKTALIHGGHSSILALGRPSDTKGWPVTLSHPRGRKQPVAGLYLRDRAMGASGVQKGQHILDPRTAKPIVGKRAAWAFTPDAATADALSTAFMVMSPDQVKQYCLSHQEVQALIILAGRKAQKDKILRFGLWKESALHQD